MNPIKWENSEGGATVSLWVIGPEAEPNRCHVSRLAEVKDISAALKAAPEEVRREVLGPFEAEIIANVCAERDSALRRAENTALELDGLRERVRKADGERDSANARAEKAERDLSEVMQRRDAFFADKDAAESELRAVRETLAGKPGESALHCAKRYVEWNHQWQSNAEKAETATKLAEGQAAFWERETRKAQGELAEAKATPILRDQTGNGHDAHPATDLPLAPGSFWEGDILRSSDGSDLRVETYHDEPIIELAPEEDGRWCKVRDVLAVLARSGLLPAGDGIPRERVREMLAKAARNGWAAAKIAISEPHTFLGTDVAGLVLADLDRETKGTK